MKPDVILGVANPSFTALARQTRTIPIILFNKGEVGDAFEVPLAFLMTPQNYKRESRDWNGLTVNYYVIPFANHNIWGATADILRNLCKRIYTDVISDE